MYDSLKEVYFDKYCKDCKWFKTDESEDPCDDCLTQPVNVDSHKPVNYEPKT